MNQPVLIIDDDQGVSELIKNAVLLHHGTSTVINDPADLPSVNIGDFALVFLDLNMPGKDGIEVINEFSALNFQGDLVLISGFDDWMLKNAQNLAEAKGLKVLEALTKPFRLDDIELLLAKVSDHKKQKQIVNNTEPSHQQLSYQEVVQAIKEKRIRVNYQPQVDIASHNFIGAEVLIRIANTDGSLIPPNLFLKAAEEGGLLHQLTKAIIRKAFKDFNQNLSEFESLILSLNLSYQDIEDVDFPNWLEQQAQQFAIEPAHVVLELNDVGRLADNPQALEVLMRLRLKGFKLSYDEVGKDQSVLELIKRFPITEVKIHPSFIADIESNHKTQLLLKTTTRLCRELGLDLVVNGIENQAMESILNDMGIVIGQGYFYAKPLPIKALVKLLKNNHKQAAEASIAFLEEGEENAEHLEAMDNDYQSKADTLKRQDRYKDYAKEGHKNLLLTALPLTGQLAYIGNSQLLGFELAFVKHRQKHPEIKLELGAYDDESNFDKHLDFYQQHIPERAMAVVGGAFPYQKSEDYLRAIRRVDIPLIAPFNGCSHLRDSDYLNLVNFKPSFKEEIEHLVKYYLNGHKEVLVLRPKMHLQSEYAHLEKRFPDWQFEYYHQFAPQELVSLIHKNKIKKVLFIGSAKYLINLMEAVDNPDVQFFAASLTGFALVRKILKRTARINLIVTDPVPNFLADYPVAKDFNELASHLDKDQRRYVNAVSFEAYLIMTVLLDLIAEKQVSSRKGLMMVLQDLLGHEIGLDDRLTFAPQTRTLMHKIYEHKI